MKHVILIVFSCLLCACGTQKKTTEAVRTETENNTVEVKYERILVPDTVFVEVPAQSTSVVTPEKSSVLENDFAKSEASIDSFGMLHHSLETKPQKKPVEVEVEKERRDSVVYKDREVKVPYPVERELSWWEKTCIDWFGWVSVIALALLCWTVRKPVIRVIRRFILP